MICKVTITWKAWAAGLAAVLVIFIAANSGMVRERIAEMLLSPGIGLASLLRFGMHDAGFLTVTLIDRAVYAALFEILLWLIRKLRAMSR